MVFRSVFKAAAVLIIGALETAVVLIVGALEIAVVLIVEAAEAAFFVQVTFVLWLEQTVEVVAEVITGSLSMVDSKTFSYRSLRSRK